MNRIFYLLILSITIFTSCKSRNTSNHISIDPYMGVDLIDAYELAFDRTLLFNEFDRFIDEVGLPNTVSIFRDTTIICNREELDSIIASIIAKGGTDIVTFQYRGFEMGFIPDNRIMPEKIDFRITDKSVQYNGTTFDQTYTIDMFKKQFAQSASFPLDSNLSLFLLTTNEDSSNLEHYMLLRKSKDDPYAEPTLELTFKDGRLIYIFFANF